MPTERTDIASAGPACSGEKEPEDLGYLLSRVADGDRTAFAAVYKQMAGTVYGLACAMTGDAGWSRELAAEALTQIWRAAPQYGPSGGSAQSWVTRTARQHVISQLRAAETKERDQDPTWLDRHPTGTGPPASDGLSALGLISGPQHQAVRLALYGGHTQDEISDRLEVAPQAVARLIRDGLLQVGRGEQGPMVSGSYPATSGRLTAVTAPAEIDVIGADQLRLSLLQATASGHDTVVVDMSHSRFCDCTGLSVLIQAHNRALAAGGELRLLLPADGLIPRLFRLTGLHRTIPVFATMQDALSTESAARSPGVRP